MRYFPVLIVPLVASPTGSMSETLISRSDESFRCPQQRDGSTFSQSNKKMINSIPSRLRCLEIVPTTVGFRTVSLEEQIWRGSDSAVFALKDS
jgi:hypothetical protein